MKLAIHHREGSFSDIWIKYCKENGIDYKIVNAYDSDVVEQLKDCDAFMWHHHQSNYRDALFAKQLLFSLQQSGITVFPDFNTGWHLDDKLGEKYLFESHGIKAAPSWVFYDKKSAYKWIRETSFPKVFKLRRGSGSSNVMLVHNDQEAKKLVKRAFGKGFPQYRGKEYVLESYKQYTAGRKSLCAFLRSCGRLFIPNEFTRMHAPEKGYAYFQEFIPNEGYDIRIIVVGDRAFGVRRNVRQGDFRASGSGDAIHDKSAIDERVVSYSFQVADILKTQLLVFDYVLDRDTSDFYICEVSYGHCRSLYHDCPGYWTKDMVWHGGTFNSISWVIENFLASLSAKKESGAKNFVPIDKDESHNPSASLGYTLSFCTE